MGILFRIQSLANWVLTGPVQVVAILSKIAGNLLQNDIKSFFTNPSSHANTYFAILVLVGGEKGRLQLATVDRSLRGRGSTKRLHKENILGYASLFLLNIKFSYFAHASLKFNLVEVKQISTMPQSHF